MSKTGRKWLNTDWADPDCVRAQDIPYDGDDSVKDRIDNVYTKDQTYSQAEVNNLLGTSGAGMSIWQVDMLSY